jgi:hypothetical protein
LKLLFGNSPTALETFEFALTAVCLLLAYMRPGLLGGGCARVEDWFGKLAQRPWAGAGVIGLLPLAVRAALLPIYGPPTPAVHDEYGFLLQADTFASGRLTNASPVLWPHFESIYILVKPTYTAQYQMAQGLVLAAGKVVAGNPWIGVFVSMGILCALLYWMLRAWVPERWALFGGVLAGLQFGVLSYWMNSYFGGTAAAIGGTLVLGALPRLRERPGVGSAAIAAGGLAILMNSRPLEAFLLLLIFCGALLWWLFVTGEMAFGVFLRKVFAPMALMLVAALGFMGYYNYRVTGRATQLPYELYRKAYGTPQGFFWQKPLMVAGIVQPEIEDEYRFQLKLHERRKSLGALVGATVGKFRTFWGFYLGPALSVPLVFLPFIWRGRNLKLALAAAVVFGLDYLTFFAFLPQYAAPVTGVILLVVLLCWRRMREQGPRGLFLSRALFAVVVLGVAGPIFGRLFDRAIPARMAAVRKLWAPEFQEPLWRAVYMQRLLSEGGRHLVIVRYRHPGHQVDTEWVYNDADIDRSPVVWAREIAGDSNEDLIEYFAGRKVWLGLPDENPPRLEPYVGQGQGSLRVAPDGLH